MKCHPALIPRRHADRNPHLAAAINLRTGSDRHETLGRCLDVTGNVTANFTKLQLRDCNGAQVFRKA